FSLVQLKQISKLFNAMTTIYEAQDFLNQSLEKQKVNVKLDGILMNITLYFQREVQAENIISTTNDYNSQEINYQSQPVEYNTVEQTQDYLNIPITTNTTTETVENTYNYIPETTNYEVVQDNNVYTTTTDNQTYENYDYGATTNYENYGNYQTYENVNYDTNANANYDFNLNNAVEVQQTQTNTYEATTIQTPKIETETLTLSLTLKPQEQPKSPFIDNKKYLIEIEQLKNQIRILKEENTILKTKTIEKTIVQKTDNSGEVLLLRQEIERLKQQIAHLIQVKTNFEIYKKQKEEEIAHLKLRIEELLKQITVLEQRIYKESLIKQQSKTTTEKQSLTLQDTRLEIVKGDIIQSAAELELLTRKICKDYHKITLNLLYKATVDSDKASIFHEKCDGATNSLVLVQSTNGKRFGGYTSCSWEGNQIDKKDEAAFVFSLDKMVTYNVIPEEDALGCYPNYGPVFLGCQIRIFDEFFKKGGSTFEKGMNYDTNEDFELTGGLKNFDVKEIEVYGIELK
ncbi:MAG: TLD domain-containing protein, partial [Bacilli bacterium]|nr:TLD domain-containing protein [Bacilli bacterium]